jgi:DNA-binding IclR family transcriptional regulator
MFLRPRLAIPNRQRIGLEGFIGEVRQAQASGYCVPSWLVDAFTHWIAAPIFGPEGQVGATLCPVLPVDTTAERCEAPRDLLIQRGLALSTLPGDGGSFSARASGSGVR